MRQKIQTLWQFLFGDSARAFGTLSVVLLICLAIAPAKDRFREWTRYQAKYLRLIRGRGEAATLQRRFEGGLQQIWMPELGVTDRCGTCHLGLKEASLWDVSTQPFRPHPPIPHSLDRVRMRDVPSRPGCRHGSRGSAPQHAGVGAANPARALFGSRVRPVSLEPLTGTPQLNLGRQLLTRYGCVSCHVLNTPEGQRLKSTTDAPPLTHIAEKTTPRMDVRLAEESAGLRDHRHDAEFPIDGCRRARHHGIPDGAKHAVPGGAVTGFRPVNSIGRCRSRRQRIR